ncbi:hypothetical protein [Paucibacter soli]|uniref:hypothetical protein n=1 Tax=Paucibacter soli TaxID=3133433 RepID=UPI00309CD68E
MTEALQNNDLDLAAIDPRRGAKYSPNLHAFLKRGRNAVQQRLARVYKDPEGVLWLGYPDDEFFIGARLMSILCNGAKTETFAHTRLVQSLTEVEDFWLSYVVNGRCAIDPAHTQSFIGDDSRWSVDGEQRTCNWCSGATQRMKRWTEVTEKSGWVAEPTSTAV